MYNKNKNNFAKISGYYNGANLRAIERAEKRSAEIERRYPEIAALRSKMKSLSSRLFALVGTHLEDAELDKKMDEIQEEYVSYERRLEALLISVSLPPNSFAVQYECEICSDTGMTCDGFMCECMKKRLILASIESSGLRGLINLCNFDNFDINFHSGEDREKMSAVLNFCRTFANNFTPSAVGLLFVGDPGTGKTHLSTAIASVIIERGFDVVYTTAQDMTECFETKKFHPEIAKANDFYYDCERYIETDLLILDDLGTEIGTQFTASVIYNVINSRINAGLCTIISTNLNIKEIEKRYGARVSSRLLGELDTILMRGVDVRLARKKRGQGGL